MTPPRLTERAPSLSPSHPRPTPRMGSEISKAKCYIPVESKTVIILPAPRVPQEIIDGILDHLVADSPGLDPFLRSCSLVSKSWVPSCRRHLFHTILFTPWRVAKWLKAFPVPEESPAHHVRRLHFSLAGYYGAPERFFEYTPWFTNVKRVTLFRDGEFQPLRPPSFARLPPSVTSLTISANTLTLVHIRDIMAQLHNLNDLSLSRPLAMVDRSALPGIGAVLRGKFGGQLRLLKGFANAEVINMLLEAPTGLHFTDVQIRSMHGCLFSAIRLAAACRKTLVKLSYVVDIHGKSHLLLV